MALPCLHCDADWHTTTQHYVLDPQGETLPQERRDSYRVARLVWIDHVIRRIHRRWVRGEGETRVDVAGHCSRIARGMDHQEGCHVGD
jgi:hypothetical protein